MFYDRFVELCRLKGVTPTRASLEMGLSNATPTKWKKTAATPNGETLNRIAAYFGIRVDDLLEQEPPALDEQEEAELRDYLQMLKFRPECRMLFQLSKDATREEVETAVRIIEAIRSK